jgi:tRNA(Ile)-lysidine synthase
VSAADDAVSVAEAKTLLDPLAHASTLVLAVSGGPDSTALLFLAARWRKALSRGPKLIAVTVDHGLRPDSAGEARAVKRLARRLGVAHRTLRWAGGKPATGLQEAARDARYRLLATAAKSARADRVLTAHTLDDQAETVLIRMSRGSGLAGLSAMARESPLPVGGSEAIVLVRPLLDVPKARLIATLAQARIDFAQDPSNRDPRFTRARLRDLMPALAREGLDARRFAMLARRLRRADAAIEAVVDAAADELSQGPWSDRGPIVFDAERFARLPAEVALRLLGRAIARTGDEGPVELGKLEALHQALESAKRHEIRRFRRTLGGALVTRTEATLAVERAPARRASAPLNTKFASGRAAGAGEPRNRTTRRIRTALTTGNFGRRDPWKRR